MMMMMSTWRRCAVALLLYVKFEVVRPSYLVVVAMLVRRSMRTVAPAAQGALSRTTVSKLVVYITLHLMGLL